MEILVAVIAFAGALLAAIATGALVTRLREESEGWLIAWTVAAGSLCLSLTVIGIGHVVGFGAVTFKLFQLTGSLLAPLWMAIGLIQLLAEKTPPKFLAWLLGSAYTVTASVILIMDPLRSDEMGKTLPKAATHWAIIPDYLLVGAHVVAALIMAVAVVVAALRWRDGDEYDTDNLHASLVIVPSGLALMGGMRFAVPGVITTVLLVVAAAAIWYCVLRPLAPYEDDDDFDDFDDEPRQERRPAGHRMEPEPVAASPHGPAPVPPRPRSSGLGDLVAEYRATGETDYAARMSRGPATGETGYGGRTPQGHAQPDAGYGGRMPQGHAPPETGYGGRMPQDHALPDAGPATGYVMNGVHSEPAPPPMADEGPATGAIYPGADVFTPRVPVTGPQPAVQAAGQGPSGKLSPNIYGMLTVFTLIDGTGPAFDQLAEQTVDAVRQNEPDTLVYACHSVKSAPLQRIVYEIYRDEVAYRDHQRQPHVERFVNERQAMVLATNVIELDINAAKVVPLPTVMF